MGWTTPRTWTDGERVTAAMLNEQIRDNLASVVDEVAGYALDAAAARDDAIDVSGISTPDGVVEALVNLAGSNTTSALRGLYASNRLLNIKDYGALCDGTTNDVLAIRAAITAVSTLRASGFARPNGILIPHGTTRVEVNGTGGEVGTTEGWSTKFAVVIPSDFIVAGEGPSSVVKVTGVPATAYGNPNHNSALGVEEDGHDVVFRDFVMVGENGTYASGFAATNNNDSAAIDVGAGAVRDVLVQGVTFRNLYGFPVHDRGENTRIHVKDCTVLYCANGVNVNANYGVFIGNTLLNSEGFECSGKGTVISNNTLVDMLGTVAISAGGNFSTNAEYPGSVVSFNTINGSAGGGISVNDAFVNGAIIGNTVTRTAKIGIAVVFTGGGSHKNAGNIVANNNIVSAGASGGSASDAVGLRITGTGPQFVYGNVSRDGGLSGYSQKYGLYIAGSGVAGSRFSNNYVRGGNYDVEIDTTTNVQLDDSNDYTSLSLVSSATLGTRTTNLAHLHKGVHTFENHIAFVHPTSGVSNYTVAAGAAASSASRAASPAGGTDSLGQISITVPGGATGALATVTFARAWVALPRVFLTVSDAPMATAGLYISSTSTTAFTVSCANAIAAGTYSLRFMAIGTAP